MLLLPLAGQYSMSGEIVGVNAEIGDSVVAFLVVLFDF